MIAKFIVTLAFADARTLKQADFRESGKEVGGQNAEAVIEAPEEGGLENDHRQLHQGSGLLDESHLASEIEACLEREHPSPWAGNLWKEVNCEGQIQRGEKCEGNKYAHAMQACCARTCARAKADSEREWLPPNGEGDGSKICIGAGGSVVACDRGTRCNIHGTVETRSGGSTKDYICIKSKYLLNDGQAGAPSKICIGSRKAVECVDQNRQCNHTPSEPAYTCGRLRRFYAVGHMANTVKIVKYFQREKYNAIEMDVQYDEVFREPVKTYHGSPCDCSCPWIGWSLTNVCSNHALEVCISGEPFQSIIEYLATNWHDLPLLWIDAKPKDDESPEISREAGKKMVHYLEKHLLAKGFQGIVLVDSGKKEYLERASSAAAALPEKYRNQLYFSYYNNELNPYDKLAFMRTLDTPRNIIFHAGISGCLPKSYPTEISQYRGLWERGLISSVFTWSFDTERNWQKFHDLGASGIITNEHDLPRWAAKKGIEMAKVGDGSILPCLGLDETEWVAGWCLGANEEDPTNPHLGTAKSEGECAEKCRSEAPAGYTACEYDGHTHTCSYHTVPITHGSGTGPYRCAINVVAVETPSPATTPPAACAGAEVPSTDVINVGCTCTAAGGICDRGGVCSNGVCAPPSSTTTTTKGPITSSTTSSTATTTTTTAKCGSYSVAPSDDTTKCVDAGGLTCEYGNNLTKTLTTESTAGHDGACPPCETYNGNQADCDAQGSRCVYSDNKCLSVPEMPESYKQCVKQNCVPERGQGVPHEIKKDDICANFMDYAICIGTCKTSSSDFDEASRKYADEIDQGACFQMMVHTCPSLNCTNFATNAAVLPQNVLAPPANKIS